jgi:hypothetical protein
MWEKRIIYVVLFKSLLNQDHLSNQTSFSSVSEFDLKMY